MVGRFLPYQTTGWRTPDEEMAAGRKNSGQPLKNSRKSVIQQTEFFKGNLS
jgi:hypothetical protein